MRFLDLTKLMEGQAMTLPCILSKNGYSFRSSALLDSGANGYTFIDTTLFTLLFPLFKPHYQLFENSIGVKGYNGAQGRAITHYTFLNLSIDGREQSFVPFLITDLGSYSIILDFEAAVQERQQEENKKDQLLAAINAYQHTRSHTCLNNVLAAADEEPSIPPAYQVFHKAFSKDESNVLPPHRLYNHKIILEGEEEKALRYSPFYKMLLEQLEVVKEYLIDNLAKGFIKPSQALYTASVLFVRKPNGTLRFCIDFRLLNSFTRKNRYPLPLIDETLARLADAKIYTKLDIRQAFHRIRMDPASEEYTTFRTRYGSYKCKVLPFGLTNGPATYQRYMNDVLFDYLDVFCIAYLDDILIYSENEEDHEAQVKLVLARLEAAGLQADLKKCEFNVKRTKYLGFIIFTEGVEVDSEKVEVVESWTYPTTVKGVQSFLGFCNFYCRFIKDYGIIAKPLTDLTKAKTSFHFDDLCRNAFNVLKQKLISAPLLQHYNYNLPCMLETDASDGVIASVLSQKHGDEWLPVAYFSKTMVAAELNYEVHDKEMLSIIRSLGHWKSELAGFPYQIRIYTDHKALEYFMITKALNA
ncbi:hypothetical protein DSL72_005429 [Monilinia vaccinii-corymbosi]|uniref:Reverse transcriptase domain-containing protein n=1 Tax=Monilinia vaccinii-corymbosi TaxID=61207 RepID=A0A8A3PFQ3_9HELO|nr:hypothetical protein DSL72_005429 [Monilinia vaccinii-corymbosi]